MDTQTPDVEAHLTDAELFALAAPATGDPEAIPRHLSRCRACSRALLDWKAAVRALADDEAGELDRRTPEQWKAAEDSTMAAIRRAGRPGRRSHPLRWAVGVAASLVVVFLAMPGRKAAPVASLVPTPAAEVQELSASDRADDELLREASFLAAGGDDANDADLEGRL
jgi:hypothetical protein